MSDNTSEEEQQQQMKEIFISADVWLEIFALISPRELGLKVALISDRFDRLVDEHFKTRKWSLGTLQILPLFRGNGAQIYNGKNYMPIPQGPLPGKVIGFEWIQIRYIDRSVIELLQRIRRLFNSSGTTVAICTFENQSRSWDIIRQKIWPLINDNIRHLRVCAASQLDRLRQDFPAILRNCTNLRSIDGLFPVFPVDDNANASSNKAVAKWVLARREDGRPNLLYCDDFDSTAMEGLKRAFVNASQPANFIIRLEPFFMWGIRRFDAVLRTFELTNNLTRERLNLRRQCSRSWLLVRSPIEREKAKWDKWEKEAIQLRWTRQWNCIFINFNDMDIGDGMLDANDKGPSEPKK